MTVEIDDLLRILEDAQASSPTTGLLYVFYSVRKNNFESGRNTARPGLKNAPPVFGLGPLTAATQATVTAISQAVNQSESTVGAAIAQVAKTAGQDFGAAAEWFRHLVGV
jgi:hypothetical protein